MVDTSIQAIRAILIQKRDALDNAVRALDAVYGGSDTPPVPVADPSNLRPKSKRKAGQKAIKGKFARDGALPALIVAALRAKSPQRPNELATALNIRRPVLTYHMRSLTKSGVVVATGNTGNRQFSLPRPTKEAP